MESRKYTAGDLEFVEVKVGDVDLDMLTNMGPRIVDISFRKSDYNPCFLDKRNKDGQWRIMRGKWPIVGGTRIWPHQGEETEMSYAPDLDPCEVRDAGEGKIGIVGAPDPVHNIRRGFRISEWIGANNAVTITLFAQNIGDMVAFMGLWELTCFRQPGNTFLIPVGGGPGFQRHSCTIYTKWAGHSSRIVDPQFEQTEDFVVIKPNGIEAKRAYTVPQRFMVCQFPEGDFTLVKIFPWRPERWSDYSGGHNAAIYISPGDVGDSEGGFIELEVMGPAGLVQPGQEITLRETWIFLDGIIGDKEAILTETMPYL